MEKTLNHIVNDILEALSNYDLRDDFSIDEDLIAYKVHDIRMLLMRDTYNNGILDGFFSQSCCLEVKCRKLACPEGDEGYTPFEEYYIELPAGVPSLDGAIKYFGGLGWSDPWTHVSVSGFMNTSGRRFTSHKPFFMVVNNNGVQEAIVKNIPTSGTMYVCAFVAWNNPVILCNWDENTTYPMPGDLIHKLEYLVIKHFMETMGLPRDLLNDAADRLGAQQQQKDER